MIQLKVNGVMRSFCGEPEMPLLWYLRDVLGLTGNQVRLRRGGAAIKARRGGGRS